MSYERDIVDTKDWRKECDRLLVEMQERQTRTTPRDVVAAVISEQAGLYLIAQRKGGDDLAGKWEVPGGKVEKGESLHAALLRELREEIGPYPYIVGDKIFEAVHEYPWGNFRVHFFSVQMIVGTLPTTGSEGQPLKWVFPANLKKFDLIGSDRHMIVVDAFNRGWLK